MAHFNEAVLKRRIEMRSSAEVTARLVRDGFFLDAVVDIASFAEGRQTASLFR